MFRSRTFFRPLDALLIAVVAGSAIWAFTAFGATDGTRAVLFLGNRKFAWYDLSGPKRLVDVPTRIGSIRIEVGDGSVRVVSTPCPNRICLKTGTIRRAHSEIICMPARMLIVLESDRPGKVGTDGGTDAVTY